ncbi:phosphopantetheine-binding protein [Streptomyces sp. NPDC047000]|uniref:phosphopantetheine-binding protein n=1 Tax=Streptomyces sp. NPDC047000 TaxID=3155474 RepID=UPI0033E6ED2D
MDRTKHVLDTCAAGLRRHPAVLEAVGATLGDGEPVVYVLVAQGHSFDGEELRRHLRQGAGPVPEDVALVRVPELPRAGDGSVDIAGLPVYGVLGGLLPLWREAFGNDGIGPDDDFFALGGYSMLAVRLVGRIADRYGVDLPLADFFDLPTVLDVAHRLTALGASPTAPAVAPRAEDELSLEDLLADVDRLSEEQALTLLGLESPPADDTARG